MADSAPELPQPDGAVSAAPLAPFADAIVAAEEPARGLAPVVGGSGIEPPPIIDSPRQLLPSAWMNPMALATPPGVRPPPTLRDPRPPVWPALVITVATIPASLVVGIIIGVIAVVGMLMLGRGGLNQSNIVKWLIESPTGLLILIVPTQLVFFVGALIGAKISRRPWREALGWQAPRRGLWLLPLLVVGTFPILALSSSCLDLLLPDWLEEGGLFSDVFTIDAGSRAGLALMGALTLLPGVVEETLFRGYLQRTLMQRWHPLLAVLASTGLFAAAHIHPLQVAAVIPLGLWLGVIAWRTGSVWYAMACHAANNAVAVAMLADSGGEATLGKVALVAGPTGLYVALAALGISILALAWPHPQPRRQLAPNRELAVGGADAAG